MNFFFQLLGWDVLNENGEDVVYIGQAHIKKNGNGMLGRIFELHPTIDYWQILSSL